MAGPKGVVNLLQQFLKTGASSGTLDAALGACKVVSGSPGTCVLSMTVDKPHTNLGGTMHGGFSAHLVDSVTTAALMTNDGGLPGVSVDMHMTYMKVKLWQTTGRWWDDVLICTGCQAGGADRD